MLKVEKDKLVICLWKTDLFRKTIDHYRVISDDVSNLSKGAQTNKTSSKKSLPSLSASGCKLVVNFLFCCNSVIWIWRTILNSRIQYNSAMVICAMISCSHRSDRDSPEVKFFRIPKVIKNQGKDIELLTERRRGLWLAAISRQFPSEKIVNIKRVCSAHFIRGKTTNVSLIIFKIIICVFKYQCAQK